MLALKLSGRNVQELAPMTKTYFILTYVIDGMFYVMFYRDRNYTYCQCSRELTYSTKMSPFVLSKERIIALLIKDSQVGLFAKI